MDRTRKCRMVKNPPKHNLFKPTGVAINDLEVINLTIDEFEAIRLADLEGLDQQEASERMGISRPTFTRLIQKARLKVATFLVESRGLNIEGGNIHFKKDIVECLDCGTRIEIEFENKDVKCPNCGSTNFASIAAKYGHGRCCRNRNRGGQMHGHGRHCGQGQNKQPK